MSDGFWLYLLGGYITFPCVFCRNRTARKLFNGKHAPMLKGMFSVKQDDTYESVECFNSE